MVAVVPSRQLNLGSPTFAVSESPLFSLQSPETASSASSGVPGPGYLPGKALKWLGEKSLNALVDLIIRGRIQQHLASLRKWRKWDGLELRLKQHRKILHILQDVLEMSRHVDQPGGII